MERHVIETFKIQGYKVNVYHDDMAENPLDDHDCIKVVQFSDYAIGNCDDFKTPQEFEDYCEENEVIRLPLYMLDHSGITVSTGPYSCPWDSGQIGWVYMDKADAAEFGDPETALRNAVKALDMYVTGSVYGFEVVKPCARCGQPEVIDSCWGLFSDSPEDLEAQIRELADIPAQTAI